MSLRELLPEPWRSDSLYWDDRAAMEAYLEAVEALAKEALSVARFLDTLNSRIYAERANELHATAAYVVPGIEER